MKTLSKSRFLAALPLLFVVVAVAWWGYQYSTHSTPEKALARQNPTSSQPVEAVKLGKGTVLITSSSQSLNAWYMTKNLWGWHASGGSEASLGLSPHNYNVDFESMVEDGQTFVWGTTFTPIKEIVFRHQGKKYTTSVGDFTRLTVWHMVLPFPETLFRNSEWSMVKPNGQSAPLFKS